MPVADPTLAEIAKVRMSDEFSDYTLYDRLSKTVDERSPYAGALRQLSATEHRHYEFWRKYVPEEKPKVATAKLYWTLFLRRVLGLTFATKYLDRHESKVVKEYQNMATHIPDSDRKDFDEMVADEKEHEKEFAKMVESRAVQYISFIILGLADALVEVSGIHAGSLGLYNRTEIAGLAGVVAGGAASIAMASAAFAQAKQGFPGSPRIAAIYTGVSYFVCAVFLATPYFLTGSMVFALGSSLAVAVVLLAITTYYSIVISDKTFARDFLEILGILLLATVALFAFGYFVGSLLHLTVT
jgi:VIT1/CCC1 family predicted Fe2+/Mn2+ transporter